MRQCGHPDTESNTYTAPKSGRKFCRICRKASAVRVWQNSKADKERAAALEKYERSARG